jgi:AbrB family looped-hinge helix DNA binding protein
MTQIHSATLKVIQGGRITIPTEVRELENIQEGDYVKITIEKIERRDNSIMVGPIRKGERPPQIPTDYAPTRSEMPPKM